jgi:predicted GH43/DUF377 family glycosyl hydrolase
MKWIKKKRIFCPDDDFTWMKSHAANPVAEHLLEDKFRVYFSCRDKNNRSSIGYVELNICDPGYILDISSKPVLEPGGPGLFDDSGVSIGCLNIKDGKQFLYYLGWNLGVTVPWRNSIGLAISQSSDSFFSKYSKAPIVDRNHIDPFSLSYPWVMRDGSIWKMWYGSNLSWGTKKTSTTPADMMYVIKYAESSDGIQWERTGLICINFKSKNEYAIARPCVLKDEGIYKMWYSYRGDSYRIGYAESLDGINWERKDGEVGIDVSKSGWDSEMIEYPFVFDHKGERYMLYNGNGYGETGIGLAVLATE